MIHLTWFAVRMLLVAAILIVIAFKGPWDIPYVPFASYDECGRAVPAQLVPEPSAAGMGSAAGEALRNLDAPDAGETQDVILGAARGAGEFVGWFAAGLRGHGKPKVPNGSLLDRDWSQQFRSTSGCEPCPGQGSGSGAQPVAFTDSTGLDAEQTATAAAIIGVGRSLGVPDQGLVVAIAAARQESGIRPLTYGHLDSVGPFQQRAAWGPTAERIDPSASARRFFTGGDAGQRGLLDVSGWESMSVAEAAQAVQVSAFPDAYARWEPLARSVVAAAGGGVTPATCTASVTPAGVPTAPGGWSLPAPRAAIQAANEREGRDVLAKPHHDYPGADLPIPVGTAVYAVQAGKVVRAGPVSGYGDHYVEVQSTTASGGCVLWWYGHGSAHHVSEGEQVAAGQQLVDSGDEGYSTGPHLHLGLRPCGTGLDRDVYQCPQPILVSIWAAKPVPDPATAPRTGCTGPPLNAA